MRERTFTARRGEAWDRLEALLAKADRRGLRSLVPEELETLALLYRSATSDLAAAQSREYGADLRAYLNRLTARAHAYVYASSARAGWKPIAEFFGRTFPAEVRRSAQTIAAATTLFVLAWIVSYALVAQRPLNVYALVPAQEIPVIRHSLHDSNFAFDRTEAPAVSSFIITNNIKVAAFAFAGGVTFGVVTLWIVLNNGLMIGALGAMFAARGFGTDFWATIAPHGVIELTAIQISAAGGMLIAKGLVAPGRSRRIDAVKESGRRAAVLVIGVAAMLVVAGTIEGFVTPQRTSIPFRFTVGALTALAMILYFTFAGRNVSAGQGEQDAVHVL